MKPTMRKTAYLLLAAVSASLLFGCSGGDSSSGVDQSRTDITEESEELTVDESSTPITEESAEPSIEIIDEDEELFVDESDLVEQTASSFKVTTPNGGQKWTTGKSYAIKWTKGKAGATVKIQLLKSNKHYKWISKKTKNDGKLVWKIPTTVVTSSAYKIKITSVKNKNVFDTSNKTFKITKATSGGTLKVTTPNCGQKWTTGKSYAIKWSKGNAGAKVKILLLKNGKAYKWISKSTANDGKHTWKIPATVATGSAYKIKITSTSKKTVTDSSNSNFRITKAVDDDDSLEVISPNGGETWKKGSVVSIKWEKGSIGGKVGVYLYKSGKRYKTITANTANDGERSWTVPTTLATGSAYKVRVQSKTTPTKRDDSDRNFTISGSSSKTPTVTLSCNASSASESGGKIACTLELSSSTTKTVTIKTAYSGSATAGTDYSGNRTTHTISAGKTSTSWTLTGKSDTKTEGNETIVINVTSVTNAKESGTQRESITLTDGKSTNPTVSLSCSSSSFAESGGKSTCTLSLSKSTTKSVTVKLAYSGTATAGTDYSGNHTSRTISAGNTSTSWKLTGKSDSKTEGNETIVINVTSVTNAKESGTQRENLTLTEAIPKLTLSCSPSSVSESGGVITCTLSLSSSTSKEVSASVYYSGTAIGNGVDYRCDTKYSECAKQSPTHHKIPAGGSSVSWKIHGKSDSRVEGDETIIVSVRDVNNAKKDGVQQETLTLEDDSEEDEADPVQVTHPNGGERFDCGDAITIQWSGGVSGERTEVSLLSNEPGYWSKHVIGEFSDVKNTGSMAWAVTTTNSFQRGATFKIEIDLVDNEGKISNLGYKDTSDNVFTIDGSCP